jgi:hypothetical protein
MRVVISIGGSVLVPDMEDSVPDTEKRNARLRIQAFLPELGRTDAREDERVNGLDTGWAEADIAAVVGPHVDGISIGKVRSPDDIGDVRTTESGENVATGLSVEGANERTRDAADRIFGPLGMEHSHFHDRSVHLVPRRAVGHAPREEGGGSGAARPRCAARAGSPVR